jgi:hypothetical protein
VDGFHLIAISCTVLPEGLMEHMRKEGVQCADEHCWGEVVMDLAVVAGGEDDGFECHVPVCERHAVVLAHAAAHMGGEPPPS